MLADAGSIPAASTNIFLIYRPLTELAKLWSGVILPAFALVMTAFLTAFLFGCLAVVLATRVIRPSSRLG